MVKNKKSTLEHILQALNLFLLFLFCASILYIFMNVYAHAFNDGKDAARGGIGIFPRQLSLDNFREIFTGKSNILQAYGVTISRTVLGTATSVYLTSMAAFAIKGNRLPGKNVIVIFLLITMLFSGGMIPYYLVLNSLNLLNTFWVYIIPSLYSVWNILVMRSFFNSIPHSLEESAKLDGADDFYVFSKIYLPLSGSVIAVIVLFNAVGHWNDWFSGAFYVRTADLKPVQTLLQEMLNSFLRLAEASGSNANQRELEQLQVGVTGESVRMAMIVIVTFPIMCVYPFLQKYFVKGLTIGSVKE